MNEETQGAAKPSPTQPERPKVVPTKVPPVTPLRPVSVPPKRKTKGSENQGNQSKLNHEQQS